MLPFLNLGTIITFSHCVGKCSHNRLRSKIYLHTHTHIVAQPVMTRPGTPSSLRDLQDVRCLTALKIYNLETEGNCKISHNNTPE